MTDQLKTFSFWKWLSSVATTVFAAIVIWWLTHQGGILNPVEKVINIEGTWLTPFKNLSYNVTQNDNQYRWIIRESGVSGTGTIEGNTLVSIIDGKRVEYEIKERDSNGNPKVLFTTHPNYVGVVLFKTCGDFKNFLEAFGNDYPKLKNGFYNAVKKIPNPTCPGVLD